MNRSEVLAWLKEHGGQKGQIGIKYVEVPNPEYHVKLDPRRTVQAKQVTWTAEDDQTLTVIDSGQVTRPSSDPVRKDEFGEPVEIPSEPVYEVVGGAPKEDKDPARTPEKERDDKMIIAEKERNYQRGDGWRTDAEVKKEADDKAETARRTSVDQQNAANQSGHLAIAQSAEQRAAANDATRTKNDDARLEIERGRYTLEEERANRPTVIGTPTEDNRQIGMFDPKTGKVVAQDNPLYDEAKASAKRLQEELALAIQMNKLNADQAAQIYTQWFKANVEVPFMQASESRAQAADKRAALEATERKRQFVATNQVQRAQLGQQAASSAVNAEIGMLPYRVGPAYGDQMSAAITGLAHGGTLDGPKADAGINFTKEAFEYDAPNLKKIAKQATKAALKGVTPYDPGDDESPTADYTGINMPNADIMSSAPQQPNYIDTNSMYQNWMNSRYKPAP